MIVEGLGSVTFINGILRVQTLGINPLGQVAETGTLEIPGNKVGDVIKGLAEATTGISEKIGDEAEVPTKIEKETSDNQTTSKTKKKDKRKN